MLHMDHHFLCWRNSSSSWISSALKVKDFFATYLLVYCLRYFFSLGSPFRFSPNLSIKPALMQEYITQWVFAAYLLLIFSKNEKHNIIVLIFVIMLGNICSPHLLVTCVHFFDCLIFETLFEEDLSIFYNMC